MKNENTGGMDVSSVPTVEGSMPEDGCKNYKLQTKNYKL